MADTIALVLNIDTATGKASVKQLTDEIDKLKKSSDAVTPSLKGATGAATDTGQKAMQAKGAVAALGAALGLISPQAQQLVMGLGNLSGALGGVSKAATLVGGTLAAGGVVAVAIAGFALIWKTLADNVKTAEKAMDDAAKKATERQALFKTKEGVKLEADYKTGAIDEATYQETKAQIAGAELYDPKIREAEQQLNAAKNAVVDPHLAHDEYVKAKAERDTATKKYQQELDQLVTEQADYINASFINAVSDAPKQDKKDEAAAESKAKKLAEAVVAQQVDAVKTGMQRGVDALATKGALLGAGTDAGFAAANGFQLPKKTGYNLGVEGLGGTGAFSGYTLPTFEQGYVRPTSAVVTNGYDPNAQAKRRETFMRATGGISAGLGGDVGGALMAAGPVGMGASAVMGGLSAIGEKGAKGVDEQLSGLKDTIIAALEALPEILAEVIPDFVSALLTEVVPALIQALPEILKSLLIDLPIAIAKAIASAINPFDGGQMKNGKRGFGDFAAEWFTVGQAHTDFDKKGGYAEGSAFISHDQVGMLHKGEVVRTASEARNDRQSGYFAQSARSGGQEQVVHVHNYNISGPVGDAAFRPIVERQISQAFGPGGLGYSTGIPNNLRSG